MVTDPRFQPRAGRTDDPHNALTLAERDRRWSAARAAMAARGIDCLFVVGVASNNNGNVRWLDNGDGAERYLVFPAKGAPTVLGYAPNWSRWYLENSWEGCDYRPTGASPSVAGANTIEDLGYASGTIGVVGLLGGGVGPEGTIPYMTYRNLQAQLPKATFVDASDLLMQLRIVKSAEELAMIEKAAELSNVQLDALMRHARPGLRETELAAEIVYASLRAGAEMTYDHPLLFCAGRTGYPVNRRPTDRVLRRGEMILTGHYTRFGGYHSHPHAALSLGPIPDEYREMRDAVCEDTERALELLKPGVPWEEVDRKISEGCLRRGFYHEISQAHCVGLDGVEPPYTTLTRGEPPRSRDVRPRGSIRDNAEYNDLAGNRPPIMKDFLVQEGMAVALECKVAKDDSVFLEFGPQIVIEKNGPRVLTPAAMDVIVL